MTNLWPTSNMQTLLIHVRAAVLRGRYANLTSIEMGGGGFRLSVNLSRRDTSSELSGLFTDTGFRGMLDGKDILQVRCCLSFHGMFHRSCRWTCWTNPLPRWHTMYSDLVRSITGCKSREMIDDGRIEELIQHKKVFTPLPKAMLDEICQTGL